MKILKAERINNTYNLEIEVSISSINECMENTFRRLSKSIQIPGFRKGKITKAIFEKYYNKDVFIKEAITEIIQKTYIKAIKELKLDVIDYPKNINQEDYKEGSPLKFSCSVDVKPIVVLGKYIGLEITKKITHIDEQQINDQLKYYQDRWATFVKVDRPIIKDDLIQCNLKATIDEKIYELWSRDNVSILVGVNLFGKDFDNNIIGLKQNEEKAFTINYPETNLNKEVAGKLVIFKILVTEIKQKNLPELTDEFAAKVSTFKTINELKNDIKEKLVSQINKKTDDEFKQHILKLLATNTKIDVPKILIERFQDNLFKNFMQKLKDSKIKFNQYLEYVKKTEAEVKLEFEIAATNSIISELILEEISKKEKIEVSNEELKSEFKKFNPQYTDEQIEEYMKIDPLDNFVLSIKQNKVIDFIIKNAKITEQNKVK